MAVDIVVGGMNEKEKNFSDRSRSSWSDRILDFFRGPTNVLRIIEGEVEFSRRHFGRPVAVDVDGDAHVLFLDFSMPKTTRKAILDAARLKLCTQTPFTSNELLVCVDTTPSSSQQAQVDVYVAALPKKTVEHALRQSKIGRSSVVSIHTENHQLQRCFEFSPAYHPLKGWLDLAWVIPMFAAAGMIAWGASVEQNTRQETITQLSDSLSAIRREVGKLEQDAAAENVSALRVAFVDRYESSILPTGPFLHMLRQTLDQEVVLSTISSRNGSVMVGVTAPDILGLARRLGQKMDGYSVEVEGVISRNQATGQESGMLKIGAEQVD